MKKICFIEAEGILLPFNHYLPNERRAKVFFEQLSDFCTKNKILLYVLSGFHESVAHKKFDKSFLKEIHSKEHFVCATEKYILSKNSDDEKVYREKLSLDPEFNDSYSKQVFIEDILKQKKVSQKDALLLGDDIWVDGYYTTRFSKINFALFEENLTDRSKRTERINGLAYFSLDFDSVKLLLEKFPQVDTSSLDKYVFETMKKALVGDSLNDAMKKVAKKRMEDNQRG